jgi:hypothetical protein
MPPPQFSDSCEGGGGLEKIEAKGEEKRGLLLYGVSSTESVL